jgi:sphingomyelin phosphodiesterase acid-like 3
MKLTPYIIACSILIVLVSFVWMGRSPDAPQKDATQPCFLVVSDVHLNEQKAMYSAYNGRGDAGYDLWEAAKDKIDRLLKEHKPSFILLLGDLPMHHALPADSDRAKKEISAVINSLKFIASENHVPIIFVPGNNDIPGHHNGAFSASHFRSYTGSPDDWALASGAVQYPTNAKPSGLGYYSIFPLADHRLRVIVLNTVTYLSKTNDTTQFVWLRSQLKDARGLGEKVLITMHVPPGPNYDGKASWQQADICLQEFFIRSIEPYRQSIVGILTSHTHKEGIKVYQDSRGQPMDIGLSVPGIAPGHGNYPAMELVSYGPADYRMEDVLTFYHTYSKDSVTHQANITKWGEQSISFIRDIVHRPSGTSLSDLIYGSPADSVIAYQRRIEAILNEPGPKRYDSPKIVSVTDGCE